MKVKEAVEVLETMLEDYNMLEYPTLTRLEAEAIETVLKHINKGIESGAR